MATLGSSQPLVVVMETEKPTATMALGQPCRHHRLGGRKLAPVPLRREVGGGGRAPGLLGGCAASSRDPARWAPRHQTCRGGTRDKHHEGPRALKLHHSLRLKQDSPHLPQPQPRTLHPPYHPCTTTPLTPRGRKLSPGLGTQACRPRHGAGGPLLGASTGRRAGQAGQLALAPRPSRGDTRVPETTGAVREIPESSELRPTVA